MAGKARAIAAHPAEDLREGNASPLGACAAVTGSRASRAIQGSNVRLGEAEEFSVW